MLEYRLEYKKAGVYMCSSMKIWLRRLHDVEMFEVNWSYFRWILGVILKPSSSGHSLSCNTTVLARAIVTDCELSLLLS